MIHKKLLPQAPVSAVRADTPISACVRLLRDKSIGALVIVSDNMREDVVGIFTERDLVKHMELIQKGGFWDNPVRTVMSTPVHTLTVSKIWMAPRIMAKHKIRHLPIVADLKGRQRLVGVLSMRDIFRIVMEQVDFDLDQIFRKALEAPVGPKRKLVGVFSSDKGFLQLIDGSAKFTSHLVMKSLAPKSDLSFLSDAFSRCDGLMLDLDGLSTVQLSKVFALVKEQAKKTIFFVFSPPLLEKEASTVLNTLAKSSSIHLIAKPVAIGLLYEKFYKEL